MHYPTKMATQHLFLACFIALVYLAHTQVITAMGTVISPEGIDWSSSSNFLISSLTNSTLYMVQDDGTTTEYGPIPGFPGIAILGLDISESNNKVYGCVSYLDVLQGFPNVAGSSYIAEWELDTGDFVALVNLTGSDEHPFCNDLVVHESTGDIYATDSLGSKIWKIEAGTKEVTTIFRPEWAGSPNLLNIGPNGIHIIGDVLLVALFRPAGELYRVSLTNTSDITNVQFIGDAPAGFDGLCDDPASGGIAAVGTSNFVYRLETSDDFQTISVTGVFNSTVQGGLTTCATRMNDIYVLNAYLFSVTQELYEIEKVTFSEPSTIAPATDAPTDSTTLPPTPDNPPSDSPNSAGIQVTLSFLLISIVALIALLK